MYSLGLILYELYHPFTTESERYHCLHDVRRGCLDDQFKHHWPLEVRQLMYHIDSLIDNSCKFNLMLGDHHHHHLSLFEQAWINPQQRVRPSCPVVVVDVLSMLGGLRGQFVPCQVTHGHASPTHPRSALACLGHSAPRSYALSLWQFSGDLIRSHNKICVLHVFYLCD